MTAKTETGLTAEQYVGLFTLVSIVFLVFAYVWFKSIPLGGPQQRFIVSFHDVAGLRANSPINVNGVRVGTVDQVKLRDDGLVLVTMRVDPKIIQIRKGAHFNIETFGLIGAKYADITLPAIAPDQPLPPLLDEHTVAVGDDPVVLNKIADKFGRSLASFDMEGVTQDVESSINKFDSVARDLKGTSKKVNEAVAGTDLKQTLQHFQKASNEMDTVTQQAHQMLDRRHPLLHMTFGRPGHLKTKAPPPKTNQSN